jgi:hypothetical protein
MSVPGVEIYCEKCGLMGSTTCVFGPFRYRTSCGEINVPRTQGWCRDCNGLEPVEDLNPEERLANLETELKHAIQGVEWERERLRAGRSFLKRLFSSEEPTSDKLQALEERVRRLSEWVSSPEAESRYLNPKRPPRCLSCGSREIEPIPKLPDGLNDFYDEERVGIPIGMRHPGCGGELLAMTSRYRFSVRYEDRIFDLDGGEID